MTAPTTYTTKQVATLVGMSVSQIQYYDHLGLIPALHRAPNGYRQFTPENVAWLQQVKIFAASGMSLKDLRRITNLVLIGKPATIEQRRTILSDHLTTLKHKQAEIRDQIDFIQQFLDDYDTIEKGAHKN